MTSIGESSGQETANFDYSLLASVRQTPPEENPLSGPLKSDSYQKSSSFFNTNATTCASTAKRETKLGVVAESTETLFSMALDQREKLHDIPEVREVREYTANQSPSSPDHM